MISPDKIIIGTANFNQKYGILKNKLNYRNIDKVLNFSKKKKIKFIEFSKDYNSLKLKSKNFQKNFKSFKKIDLQDKYFSTGNTNDKILEYLFEKKKQIVVMVLQLEGQTFF